jgi:hypothetical protein
MSKVIDRTRTDTSRALLDAAFKVDFHKRSLAGEFNATVETLQRLIDTLYAMSYEPKDLTDCQKRDLNEVAWELERLEDVFDEDIGTSIRLLEQVAVTLRNLAS